MRQIIGKIEKNIQKKQWPCLAPDCAKSAINSHMLQKNGILNRITSSGHLYEITAKPAFYWGKKKAPIVFKKKGLNQAFALPIFCAHHDTKIFEPIENRNNPDKFPILLSYRVTCAELRKKEINCELYSRIINANTLDGVADKDFARTFVSNTRIGIERLLLIKKNIESEIQNPTLRYIFNSYEFPIMELYASSIFSPFENEMNISASNDLVNVFFHIIPSGNKLKILVGYDSRHQSDWILNFSESWKNLDYINFQKKLTNIFINRIENWGLSENLYSHLDRKKIEKYLNYFADNVLSLENGTHYNFNLFD